MALDFSIFRQNISSRKIVFVKFSLLLQSSGKTVLKGRENVFHTQI